MTEQTSPLLDEATHTPEWREIPGFEGRYEVSDDGQVRSLDRLDTYGRRWKGRIRKHTISRGYPAVTLRDLTGKLRVYRIHRLVALAFIGPRPAGMETCHIDGDRFNNRPSNLRYATSSDNEYDKVRQGRHHEAAKTHCVHGHEFTPENTILTGGKRNYRQCRICRDDQNRRKYPRQAEKRRQLREARDEARRLVAAGVKAPTGSTR